MPAGLHVQLAFMHSSCWRKPCRYVRQKITFKVVSVNVLLLIGKNHEKLIRNFFIRLSRNLPGSIVVNVIHRTNGINWGANKACVSALKIHEFETSVKVSHLYNFLCDFFRAKVAVSNRLCKPAVIVSAIYLYLGVTRICQKNGEQYRAEMTAGYTYNWRSCSFHHSLRADRKSVV